MELIKTIKQENKETRKAIKKENEETRSMFRELIEMLKDNMEQHKVNSMTMSENITSKLEECNIQLIDKFGEMSSCIDNSSKHTEILEAKAKMNKMWQEKLDGRTNLYTRSYRNRRLNELYSEEITKEFPKIPRKFLPTIKADEDEEEKQVKQQLALEKVKAELKLQEIRYKRQDNKVSSIDIEIIRHIQENHSQKLINGMIELWKKDCLTKENQVKENFDAKEKWFFENWMNEKLADENENNLKKLAPKAETNTEFTNDTNNCDHNKNENRTNKRNIRNASNERQPFVGKNQRPQNNNRERNFRNNETRDNDRNFQPRQHYHYPRKYNGDYYRTYVPRRNYYNRYSEVNETGQDNVPQETQGRRNENENENENENTSTADSTETLVENLVAINNNNFNNSENTTVIIPETQEDHFLLEDPSL